MQLLLNNHIALGYFQVVELFRSPHGQYWGLHGVLAAAVVRPAVLLLSNCVQTAAVANVCAHLLAGIQGSHTQQAAGHRHNANP